MVPASVYDDLIACAAVAQLAAQLVQLNDTLDDETMNREDVEEMIGDTWWKLRLAVAELPATIAYPQPVDKVT